MPPPNGVGRPQNIQAGTRKSIFSDDCGSPAVATATAILAATSSVATSTLTAGFTQPDSCRNVVATPGGTTGNVLAVSVVVNGTDKNGSAITETLPPFTAGAATAVTGLKAFATITSIVLPTTGAATTIAIGTGSKLGLSTPLSRDTVLAAFRTGVREGTRPTVVFSSTDVSLNVVTLSSALNGTAVVVDYHTP